jgi:hypothetical protein
MSKTKGQHVDSAYQRLRISGLTVKALSEEIEIALEVLEDMMSEFKSRNICSSYAFESSPNPNTDSRIDPAYNNATSACLAVRLCSYFGKEVPMTLQSQATQALSNWSATTSRTNQINPTNRQPRGSGQNFRFTNWVRYYRFENNAPISCSTLELKVDEINNFGIDFNGYLNTSETISSYTTEPSAGIELISSSESGGVVTLQVKGKTGGFETVKITITTSSGRVNPKVVNFNIT